MNTGESGESSFVANRPDGLADYSWRVIFVAPDAFVRARPASALASASLGGRMRLPVRVSVGDS